MLLDCVLTLQALCEFYAATTRKKYANHEVASFFIKDLMVVFPVIVNSGTTLSLALKAAEEHKLAFWDSLLWATAKENGCSVILSEDFQDNFILRGVKIRNPFLSEDEIEAYF